MQVAGKCPPEKPELEETSEKGFNHVELYLEKKHLDNLEQSIQNIEESEVEVVSVHTPHVTLKNPDYFQKADTLASNFNAVLVFHSQYIHHVHVSKVEEKLAFESNYGYENNPGASVRHLKATILDKEHSFVLDTAHLYMAEENYVEKIEYILENHSQQVEVIHLCDSTLEEDGLGFGEGEMDMKAVSKKIKNSGFNGVLVLEVMPENQEEALEKWSSYTEGG